MSESLEQTAERYLQRWRPTLRPATIHGKKQALKNLMGYLREHHSEVHQFNQLQRGPHIEGWLEHLLYLKASSRITVIRILRLFFEDLVQWQWAQAPTTQLLSNEDLPPEPRTLPKPLPPELDQALQDVLRRAYTFPAMALLLLRLTGMRIGEMRALSLHALEGPNAGEFSLRIPLGKTHTERLIPLCPRAVGLVRDILAQRGAHKPIPSPFARYLMVNERGRHLHEQTYRNELKVLAAQLNSTERIYPHRLRHTFATRLLSRNVAPQTVSGLLGHESTAFTLARYSHWVDSDPPLLTSQVTAAFGA